MSSQVLIEQARQSNLVEYLQANGVELKKQGINRWCGVEHDSLVVFGNKFVWNSRGIEGNTLDYLIKVEGMPFKEAVARLTGQSIEASQGEMSHKRILGYLCHTRGIDYKLVTQLIRAGYITEDTRHNAAFNIFEYGSRYSGDKKGIVVGAELHGTQSKKPFKGFTVGSKRGYGFNLGWGLKEPVCAKMYVFESAIDLLSYITLEQQAGRANELNGNMFLSMGGLKPEVLNTALLGYVVTQELIICTDNDTAGKEFIEHIKGVIECTVKRPDTIYKDWNDALTGNCG